MKDNNIIIRNASKVSLQNIGHASFSPIQTNNSIAYVSGCHQITEFQFIDGHFNVIRWEKNFDGTVYAAWYCNYERQASGLYAILERDVKTGAARLSDRSSVRGAGTEPKYRSESRATDDVSAVINWIRRCEKKLDQMIRKEKELIKKDNKSFSKINFDSQLENDVSNNDEYISSRMQACIHANDTPISVLSSKPLDSKAYQRKLSSRGKTYTTVSNT